MVAPSFQNEQDDGSAELLQRVGPLLRLSVSVRVALVAVAGAGGALLRYGIVSAVGAKSLPWSIAAVNVIGSFLLGLLMAVASQRGWPAATTVPLAVGFLGSFTTFSTFSYDAQLLLRDGRTAAVLLYVALSVFGGVLAAAVGYAAASAAA